MAGMKRFAKLMLAATILAILGLALPQSSTVRLKQVHAHARN